LTNHHTPFQISDITQTAPKQSSILNYGIPSTSIVPWTKELIIPLLLEDRKLKNAKKKELSLY